MANKQLHQLIHHLRRVALHQDGAGLTDGQLLETYIQRREEAAFAALVRRHGPMVWGVCRRLLPNHADTEDAFQAAFLVLVRKAATIVPREMVANWLYGVARRTALKTRATIAKRSKRERQVVQMPEPAEATQDLWSDLRPVLDREVSRLADKYRVVVLLCDVEGKTRKEAARHLGLPEGTVASRLATARAMLAKRLTRLGVGVPAGTLAAVISANAASASVPPSVMVSTIQAAGLLAAGQAAAVLSPQVAALTQGVLKMMLLSKFKVAAAVVVVAGVLALSTAGVSYHASAADEQETRKETEKKAPKEGVRSPRTNLGRATADYNLMPGNLRSQQAIVALEKGQLVVQTLDEIYEPISVAFQGKTHNSYQKSEILKTRRFPTEMVEVFDVHSKNIDKKQLPELLEKRIVALVSTDVRAADQLNLRLFKEGTLLFILPPVPLPAAAAIPPSRQLPAARIEKK